MVEGLNGRERGPWKREAPSAALVGRSGRGLVSLLDRQAGFLDHTPAFSPAIAAVEEFFARVGTHELFFGVYTAVMSMSGSQAQKPLLSTNYIV